jgi:ABC-type phosphate transport system substrate-binding protein
MKKQWFILLILFVVLFLTTASSSFADIIIICNKSVPATTISKSELKDIFLGKKTKWDNGQKIRFILMKDSSIHNLFLKKYVKKTSSQYRNHWKQLVFTGKGRAPQKFDSVEQVLKYVAVTDGAIAYIDDKAAPILVAFSSTIRTVSVQ